MSTPAITPTEEKFDPAKFVEDRNRAEQTRHNPAIVPANREAKAPAVIPADPEKPKPGVPAEEENETRLSRSHIRTMNRLREEAAAAKREAEIYRELARERNGAAPKAKDPNAEPNRTDFATDQEYYRALARHEAKQEVSKSTESNEVVNTIRTQVQAADALQIEHQKLIPDWDEVSKDFGELIIPAGDQTTPYLVGVSDMRAFVLEHFVKNPEDWQKLITLPTPEQKHSFFSRLEGKLETKYNERLQAAQAAKEPKTPTEDRKDAAPAQARQTAPNTGSRVPLPKPSSEVAAKGGSAPPAEPAIGSQEWMHQRNQKQYGSRH